MDIIDERSPRAIELDEKICFHIARGNQNVYQIINTYHMYEISRIRDFILDILNNDILDARALNNAFNLAISELDINVEDLLTPEVKVITPYDMFKRNRI